jgi:hypothetical protein
MDLNNVLNQSVRGRVLARVLARDLAEINGGLPQEGGTCTITGADAGYGNRDITNICGDDGD